MSVKTAVLLSDSVVQLVEAQVAAGRYADFSSAVQDAAWNYFVGSPSIFAEYKLTPKEVERSARKDRKRIAQAKRKGTLRPWE